MLRIEIVDENCAENECHLMKVDVETDKAEIMTAIAVLYPNAVSILMEIEEE